MLNGLPATYCGVVGDDVGDAVPPLSLWDRHEVDGRRRRVHLDNIVFERVLEKERGGSDLCYVVCAERAALAPR